jgi:hypothetical protein
MSSTVVLNDGIVTPAADRVRIISNLLEAPRTAARLLSSSFARRLGKSSVLPHRTSRSHLARLLVRLRLAVRDSLNALPVREDLFE